MKIKSLKEHYQEGIARCEANLLTQKDPIKRDIILRQIHQYKQCIKNGVPDMDNSVYAPVQTDDTVQFSTGQGSNW